LRFNKFNWHLINRYKFWWHQYCIKTTGGTSRQKNQFNSINIKKHQLKKAQETRMKKAQEGKTNMPHRCLCFSSSCKNLGPMQIQIGAGSTVAPFLTIQLLQNYHPKLPKFLVSALIDTEIPCFSTHCFRIA
jgi:hypothetical protein